MGPPMSKLDNRRRSLPTGPSQVGTALNLRCAACGEPGGVSDHRRPFCWDCFEASGHKVGRGYVHVGCCTGRH